MNVVTHNVTGCSKNQSCKIDHIASLIDKRDTPTIYLIQEYTRIMSKEKRETTIDDVLFLSYFFRF